MPTRLWRKGDPDTDEDLKLPEGVIAEEKGGEAASQDDFGDPILTGEDDAEGEGAERGGWGAKTEFILACIGYAVGLGNIWRFPYLCYRNGGGAFLIPYVLMLALVGLPIYFLEFAFGQFASSGPITIWSISPLFKGVGYAMVCISWYISLYYNVIIATGFMYLFASFTSVLPWSNCDNWWNNKQTCHVMGEELGGRLINETTSPAVEYYMNYILQQSSGFEDFGTPVWHMTLCLLLTWILVCLSLIKGVKSLGKVSYVTAIFPYIMLTILMIRAALLEGSLEGVKYYVIPKFEGLKDPSAWTDAATQIIFSLGCCNGGLIAMSSYNKFKNNCYKDAVLVAIINCCTSIFAGFVVFATLGFVAHSKGVGIDDVMGQGPGLIFMVYPEALNQMPVPVLWCILFFLMMVTLGMGSVLPLVETVLSGAQDELQRFNLLNTWKSQFAFRTCLCCFNFLITIPMVCNGGIYLVNLIDLVLSGYPALVVCFLEIIVIAYIYGLKQFMRDIKLMIDKKMNWYWRICWLVVSPCVVVVLIVSGLVKSKPFSKDDYVYPLGIQVLGHICTATPVALIVILFVYRYCRDGGFLLLREFSKPVHDWGPAAESDRLKFLQGICERSLGPQQMEEGGVADAQDDTAAIDPAPAYQPALGSTAAMRTAESCQALTKLVSEGEFYQSRLCIAGKMLESHATEMAKQGIPPEMIGSNEQLLSSMIKLNVGQEEETPGDGESANVAAPSRKITKVANILRKVRHKDSEFESPEEGGED